MTDDADEDGYDGPSKSLRKRQSTELQQLGEALIELSSSELDALPLPESLRDAVLLAQKITAHGGLYRQKQYIGKLMRKFDSEPIREAIEARRNRERVEAVRFHRMEQWRESLLTEGTAALDRLKAEFPKVDAATIADLVARARKEQQSSAQKVTPAGRELFRVLREFM